MATVNHRTREVQFKIVYCGTPLGGKTSNLQHIHERLGPSMRGDLVSIAGAADRTLFFDFLPVNAHVIAGFRTRFQLYTVPGQRAFNETRQVVLTGVDGVVFVADSSPDRAQANAMALEATWQALAGFKLTPGDLPFVYQFNKRDLPDALPCYEMQEQLNPKGYPSFASVASTGYNVFSTLEAVTQAVLHGFHHRGDRTPPRSGSRPVPPCQDVALAS